MARIKALILASGAVLGLASSAFAADLLPPPPAIEPAPPMASSELGGGWYLRGDLGVGVSAQRPSFVDSVNNLAGTNPGGVAYSAGAFEAFNNSSLSESTFVDFGIGYQMTSWLRGDVTAEYRGGGHMQSLYTLNDPGNATTGSTQYADFYRANTSSIVGLVNIYADLGSWNGITPYVGGGVGVAHNMVSGFTDQGFGYYTPVAGVTKALGSSGGFFEDKSKTNFAWALMAGLGLDITQNVKLDLGYRYLNMGKMQTGVSKCLNGTGAGSGFSCPGHSLSTKNTLASNDFRIGLRWMLADTPTYSPAPAPMPGPIVRKY